MHPMVEEANRAIQKPEVQEMLRRLSGYGLGICMPHMHTELEDYVPLPAGVVQVETNLQISFRSTSEARGDAVAWVWDDEAKVASVCQVCEPDKSGGHKRVRHL